MRRGGRSSWIAIAAIAVAACSDDAAVDDAGGSTGAASSSGPSTAATMTTNAASSGGASAEGSTAGAMATGDTTGDAGTTGGPASTGDPGTSAASSGDGPTGGSTDASAGDRTGASTGDDAGATEGTSGSPADGTVGDSSGDATVGTQGGSTGGSTGASGDSSGDSTTGSLGGSSTGDFGSSSDGVGGESTGETTGMSTGPGTGSTGGGSTDGGSTGGSSTGGGGGPCLIEFTFEAIACPGTWTTEIVAGTENSWECGNAPGDSDAPPPGFFGMWATGLASDYASSETSALVSPEVDITECDDTLVMFVQQFYAFQGGAANSDGGIVQISTDGGGVWQDIVPMGGYNPMPLTATAVPVDGALGFSGNDGVSGAFWNLRAFDLGAYVGETVRLRFVFGSDGSVEQPGWFIDSVTFTTL